LLSLLALGWSLAATPDEITEARREGVELRWSAPAQVCPVADAVLDDALAVLGAAPPAGTDVTADAEVVRDPDGLVLTLELRSADGTGTRTVRAQQCAQLARIAALVIALSIDPSAVNRIPPELPVDAPAIEVPPVDETLVDAPAIDEPAEPPAPEIAVRREPTSPPIATRPRRPPLHASVAIAAGVGAFALPRATAAFELGLALAGRAWRVELGAGYWAPSVRDSAVNPAIGGRFQLAVAQARGCWVPRLGTVELPLCALAIVGGMLGRGTGELDVRKAASPWAAFGGGPTVMWRPRVQGGRIALLVRVEGVGAATQPAFATSASGVLWKARNGALQAFGGIEVRFASRP
jgi:hypothetical protein